MITPQEVQQQWGYFAAVYDGISSARRNASQNKVDWTRCEKTFVDAVDIVAKFTCLAAKGRLTSIITIDVLKFLEQRAREMNLVDEFDKAIVVDFINFIAMRYGLNYGMKTSDLEA